MQLLPQTPSHLPGKIEKFNVESDPVHNVLSYLFVFVDSEPYFFLTFPGDWPNLLWQLGCVWLMVQKHRDFVPTPHTKFAILASVL
jgi:hypothetical protein